MKSLKSPIPFPDGNITALTNLGAGSYIPAEKRLQAFNDDEYTSFTTNWLFKKIEDNEYSDLASIDGSNDKGRDLVAKLENGHWDNFQLKNYGAPLQPSQIYVELGKVICYTYNDDYTVPRKCIFLCPHGVGPKLFDLLNSPDKLKNSLRANWKDKCQNVISSKKSIPLEGDLLKHFENFDFEIFQYFTPTKQLEFHQKTKQYSIIFGNNLPPRPKPEKPPKTITSDEIRYVDKFLKAVSDHIDQEIELKELKNKKYSDFSHMFDYYRVCFYSSESFKRFARDNTSEVFYKDYEEQILEGIKPEFLDEHQSGYKRMTSTCLHSTKIQITVNLLGGLKPQERVGMCHQIANDDKLDWVKKIIK